ncbi:MAG: hypothetical protein WBA57_07285 [Elainellaceae cyanobacterium]
MRLLSLTILAGALALGATAIGNSSISQAQSSTSPESEHVAQNNDRNNTVHRGSGRRQILAVSVPLLHQ